MCCRLQVFTGPGSVRFQVSASTPEFQVLPEWWGGSISSLSDTLDQITRSCAGARCLVVLTRSYGLSRPWRVTPTQLPWWVLLRWRAVSAVRTRSAHAWEPPAEPPIPWCIGALVHRSSGRPTTPACHPGVVLWREEGQRVVGVPASHPVQVGRQL